MGPLEVVDLVYESDGDQDEHDEQEGLSRQPYYFIDHLCFSTLAGPAKKVRRTWQDSCHRREKRKAWHEELRLLG